MNMNTYGEQTKNNRNMFACNKWRPFELQEIFACLGIVLCGKINNCAGGGYQSSFFFVARFSQGKERESISSVSKISILTLGCSVYKSSTNLSIPCRFLY